MFFNSQFDCLRSYLAFALALNVFLTNSPQAEAPVLDHLFPVGAGIGQTVTVKAIGKAEPWPPQCWVSGDGVVFSPTEKKGEWNVEVASDAKQGPRLVRVFNEDGASIPRYFIVSQTTGYLETEPNDHIGESTQIPRLPCLIHGQMERGQDVDTFKVHLNEGETMVARMDAYVLGSTTDPLIRVLDDVNRVLAWNHDSYYLDPRIAFQAPKTGNYWIQIMGFPYPATSSERLGGGSGYIYRLLLTHQAYVRTMDLPGNDPNQSLQLHGWNLNKIPGDNAWLSSLELTTDLQQSLIKATGVSPEQEPNQSAETATFLVSHGSGILQHPGDVDWFAFKAEKDRWYRFEIQSARLGYPCDLTLKLFDKDQKELKSDDDSATLGDPRIDWKAPAAETCYLQVTSLTHDGGKDHIYRLIRETKSPSCELSVDASEFTLKPGESTEIKVTIQRDFNHDADIKVQATLLPPGVSCSPVFADKTKKSIKLFLHASPSSQPFQGELQIVGVDVDQSNNRYPAGKITVTTSVNNGVPNGYMDQVYRKIDHLWLTVPPRPKPDPQKEQDDKKIES